MDFSLRQRLVPDNLTKNQEFAAKFPTVEKQGNFSGKQGISAPGQKGPTSRPRDL
jgi:hypothetical protein